jgi:hypothetical protein
MLSRRAFLYLHEAAKLEVEINGMCESPMDQQKAEWLWHFTQPYVLIYHPTSKRGYYLDRNYNFIVDVQDPPIPGEPEPGVPEVLTRVIPHETERRHQGAANGAPEWVDYYSPSDFTTYWLY